VVVLLALAGEDTKTGAHSPMPAEKETAGVASSGKAKAIATAKGKNSTANAKKLKMDDEEEGGEAPGPSPVEMALPEIMAEKVAEIVREAVVIALREEVCKEQGGN
jgi:hypothetical protein